MISRDCAEYAPRRSFTAVLAVGILSCIFSLAAISCGPRAGAISSNATAGKCPVCQMPVKTSDDWAAEIYYKDQTKLMFESPGDMLAFYTSAGHYNVDEAHKDLTKIERITVKDYRSKQAVDGRQAAFVFKSRTEGPMGPDFLPFAKREDAEAFVAANGGTVLSLNEVTADMARDLRK